jgi:putative membrane protein
MFIRLLFNIVSGILGIYLAYRFVPGVFFSGDIKTLLIIGCVLGVVNFFLKPILKIISLPLRIITFGLFTLIINMGLVWLMEIIFNQNLDIKGIIPLFWTTIIVCALNFFFKLIIPKNFKK